MKIWIPALTFLAFAAGARMAGAQSEAYSTTVRNRRTDPTVESVRSAYFDGRFQDVVVLADRALAVRPNDVASPWRGELRFWRGASLRKLGRHEEALVALDGAERDGFSAPELRLERALALRRLGRQQEAEREYQEAERILPEDPDHRRRFSERWRREGKEEPDLQITLTPQMGYDSNLLRLDKDAPISDSDLERDSFYTGATLTAKYFLVKGDHELLAVEYRNVARAYARESDLDYTDNILQGTGRYPLGRAADVELRGAHGEALLRDGGHARTTRTVGSTLYLYPGSGWQIRLLGDWIDADYYRDDLPNEQDRDGVLQRGGLALGLDLGGGWSIGPMVSLATYEADGDDYDHQDLTVGFGLTTSEILGCVFTPVVSYSWADYDHENSLSGFSEKREDRILRVGVTVKLRQLEEWIGYAPTVGLSFLDQRSNIDVFDFERWEPRIEVAIVALSF